MAFILNECDIREAVRRHKPGAALLSRYVDMINAHSDGWPYWKAASSAAALRLQLIVRDGFKAETEPGRKREIAKALAPMKGLCTRKKLPIDEWFLGDF